MLFHSFVFLFAFLPIALGGYFFCGRFGGATAAKLWLGSASIFFYAYWNPAGVWVLLASIAFNVAAGHFLDRCGQNRTGVAVASFAIAGNLAFLGYFKYAGFFAENLPGVSPAFANLSKASLPLGISFFTFEAIAYLADILRGRERPAKARDYLLYAAFFPHLIAGPVVRYGQLMPQFSRADVERPNLRNLAVGIALLIIGLTKKCVIADNIAPLGNQAFDLAAAGQALTVFDAWIGALAYTAQIYFDFSGYSDMALGLALFFNVRLPANFLSPYQATSIGEFWRRWHITLSTFLRDYLYIPLGGNRCGGVRRSLNLMITMLLGGLWHGAGWTFLIWGGIHGLYLIANHLWEAAGKKVRWLSLPAPMAWALTFVCVIAAWVVFRAPNWPVAVAFLSSMFTPDALPLPAAAQGLLGALEPFARFGAPIAIGQYPHASLALLMAALGIAVLAPNSLELLRHGQPADAELRAGSRFALALDLLLTKRAAFILGSVFLIVLWLKPAKIEFLYFQF